MSDEPTPEPEAQEAKAPETFDADYVAKLRREAAEYRTQAKANAAAAKRLAEIEEAQKSESQKAADALAAAQREAEQARTSELRYRVGVAKGLPADFIPRLQGSTEEELAADADQLVALLKPGPTPATAPQPAPVSGAVPPTEQQAADGNAWLRGQASRGR